MNGRVPSFFNALKPLRPTELICIARWRRFFTSMIAAAGLLPSAGPVYSSGILTVEDTSPHFSKTSVPLLR
jgi:hypothetical protein